MKVQTILATKGSHIYSVHPQQSLEIAANMLAQQRIGALVVLDDASHIVGILSERDIVRAAAQLGAAMFTHSVGDIMTQRVIFGSPQDDVESVMQTMTQHRFRHLPIMEENQLLGMISIGDVVKAKLDEYQGQIETLQAELEADE